MTNGEKYLKDGVDVKELSRELCEFIKEYYGLIMGNVYGLAGFFKQPIKPTLTEDERVILRNIPKEYTTIARNLVGELSARNNDDWKYADVFNHLFQFIKEGEEYEIKELLKE